ncbi:unnamed protein product [Camellia sinensis]
MYVTRWPKFWVLVIQDKNSETTTFFGLLKNQYVKDLPLPQNKELHVDYFSDDEETTFVPVVNKPLSSNLREAYACSKEEDIDTSCCCNSILDVQPRPLDPNDIYQQFHIVPYQRGGQFHAKSIAPDGIPPNFLRTKGWRIRTRTPQNYQLGEALGINTALRDRLPSFDLPLSYKSSEAIVVGKWY